MSELDGIMDEMLARTRLDLRAYRRSMIERRIQSRMDRLCIADPAVYLSFMRRDTAECDRLAAAIAIHVSSFFRDPLVFEVIDAVVLPEILRPEGRDAPHEVQVWSAGCAKGEEPYSVAILLRAALRKSRPDCVARIFATDIDPDALTRARLGRYPRESLLEVKLGVLDSSFVARGDAWEVRSEIRDMVDFSLDDLMTPERLAPAASVFAGFDLILCRNVLIYMEPAAQERTLARFCRSLAPGGFLVLGESETLLGEEAQALDVVDARCRIFRKESDFRR